MKILIVVWTTFLFFHSLKSSFRILYLFCCYFG